MARNIQTAMLEKNFALDPRLALAAFLEPAYQVSGELYSFLLDEGRYFTFMVGDVSGKGFPAAITMSRCEMSQSDDLTLLIFGRNVQTEGREA